MEKELYIYAVTYIPPLKRVGFTPLLIKGIYTSVQKLSL